MLTLCKAFYIIQPRICTCVVEMPERTCTLRIDRQRDLCSCLLVWRAIRVPVARPDWQLQCTWLSHLEPGPPHKDRIVDAEPELQVVEHTEISSARFAIFMEIS